MSVKYTNNSKEFLRQFNLHKLEAHTKMAKIGLDGINEETPVKTGLLKSENTGRGERDYAIWENKTEYAPYVHLGTYKQAANPWIVRGVMKKSSEIIRAVINLLKVGK